MTKFLVLILLIVGAYCAPTISFAQPANDSCKHAKVLFVSPNAASIVYDSAIFLGARSEAGAGSISCLSSPYSGNDLWFTFTSTSTKTYIYTQYIPPFGSTRPRILVYDGICGNLSASVACSDLSFNSTNGTTIAAPLVLGPIGKTYLVRVIGLVTMPNRRLSGSFLIGVASAGNAGKRLSTGSGGNWFQASTWQGGIIPSIGDTAVIQDGATVFIPSLSPTIQVQAIQIGNGGTATAKLRMDVNSSSSGPQNNLQVKEDLQVNSGDSLIIGVPSLPLSHFSAAKFTFGRDLIVNGGMRVNSHLEVALDSIATLRKITGSGSIRGLFNLIMDSPGGLECNLPIDIAYRLTVNRGRVSGTGTLTMNNNGRLQSFESGSLRIGNGYSNRIIGRVDTMVNLNFGYLALYAPLTRPDTVKTFHNMLTSRPIFNGISSGRNASNHIRLTKSVFADRGLDDISGFKIINNDTVYGRFYTDGGSLPNYAWVGKGFMGIEGPGTICSKIFRTNGDAARFMMTNNRRSSHFNLILPNRGASSLYTQEVCYSQIAQKPAGSVNAPLTKVNGWQVFKINSPLSTFPLGTYIAFQPFSEDSLPSSISTWRIAQAPSPNGPWTDVTNPDTNLLDYRYPAMPGSLLGYAIRTKRNLNLANGQYFAFASAEPGQDISLRRIQLGPAAYAGVCGPNGIPLAAVINNEGGLPARRGVLRWRIEGPNGVTTGGDTVTLTMIAPGELDTVYVRPSRMPLFSAIGQHRIKVWLAGDAFNLRGGIQDTLVTTLDNRPVSVPYTNGYTRANVLGLPSSYWINTLDQKGTQLDVSFSGHPVNGYEAMIFDQLGQPGVFTTPKLVMEPVAHNGQALNLFVRYQIGGFNLDPLDSAVIEYTTDCGRTFKRLVGVTGLSGRLDFDKSRFIDLTEPIIPIVPGHIALQMRMLKMPLVASISRMSLLVDSIAYQYVTGTKVAVPAKKGPYLFPNPATSEVAIMGLTEELTPYTLINNLGQVVRRGKANASDNKIPLQGLPRGLYTVATERERLRLVVE